MKIDTSHSIYAENPKARKDFTREEWDRLLYLLRRLQFLEYQVETKGGIGGGDASGGGVHAVLEIRALEFVLTEMDDFLIVTEPEGAKQ